MSGKTGQERIGNMYRIVNNFDYVLPWTFETLEEAKAKVWDYSHQDIKNAIEYTIEQYIGNYKWIPIK